MFRPSGHFKKNIPMNKKKIILVALISSKTDIETFLNPVRKWFLEKEHEIIHELIQRKGVSRSKKPGGAKKLETPLNAKTYLGSGKVLELKKIVEEKKPEKVVFLNNLSAHQASNVEEIISCKVEVFSQENILSQ